MIVITINLSDFELSSAEREIEMTTGTWVLNLAIARPSSPSYRQTETHL